MTNYSPIKICFALRRMALQHGMTHYVTFNPNRGIYNVKSAHKNIERFLKEIDYRLYGKNSHLRPLSQRTSLVAFAEHMDSNLHFHGVLTTPDIKGFNRHAPAIWRSITKSGSLHIEQKKFSRSDREFIASYITKDAWKVRNQDAIFFPPVI